MTQSILLTDHFAAFFGIVDLLAILPYYIEIILQLDTVSCTFFPSYFLSRSGIDDLIVVVFGQVCYISFFDSENVQAPSGVPCL